MIIRYDSFNRVDHPKITLCNPGAVFTQGLPITRSIGVLTGYEADEFVFNFNAPSELNFRLNSKLAGAEGSICVNVSGINICELPDGERENRKQLYNDVKARRLLFVDDIGFFEINKVTESFDEGIYYKDVSAESIETELRKKTVPFISDGTYLFYVDPESPSPTRTGMLNMIVDMFPLWSIGSVNSAVAGRYRTFENVDITTDCLSFLSSDVQKAYDCIIEFDPIHRVVNVFDRETYPESHKTDIYLSTSGLIDSANIIENTDGYCTAMHVTGGDNLSINSVNPLGGSTIYNFNHFLDWFSTGLRSRVIAWMAAIDAAQSTYSANCLTRDIYTYDVAWSTAECNRANTIIDIYQRLRDNIVAANNNNDDDLVKELVTEVNDCIEEYHDNNGEEIEIDEQVSISDQINDILAAIDSIIDVYEMQYDLYHYRAEYYAAELVTLNAAISTTINSLSFATFFTAEQYEELSHYFFESSYVDEYIVVTDIMTLAERQAQRQILYETSREQLARKIEPPLEFDITVNNLLFVNDKPYNYAAVTIGNMGVVFPTGYNHIVSQLATGCLINVEIEKPFRSLQDDVSYVELVVLGITVNFEDHTMSITVGNKYDRADPKALFEEIFKE